MVLEDTKPKIVAIGVSLGVIPCDAGNVSFENNDPERSIEDGVVGPNGRAAAPEGAPPFPGQVFFHPEPGQLGNLQMNLLTGPTRFHFDFGILKRTRIRESHWLELRMEASNLFNHPVFSFSSQDPNQPTFGRMDDSAFDPRRIQFSLHYRF